MAKYVRCDNCGKKIHFGELICIHDDDETDIAYCSSKCLVDSYKGEFVLTEEQATYWGFEIFDDKARKRAIEKQIKELQKELDLLSD